MKQAAGEQHRPGPPSGTGRRLGRWLPVAALLLIGGLGYALGLHRHISLTALAENRDVLRSWVDGHFALALLSFMILYVAVVALSIAGAAIIITACGFLFGWPVSTPATVIAAVLGAVIVFQIVKTSLGAALAERAGPFTERLSRGFAENAFGLLLFLRLTPLFPFWAVNAVAGLSRIPLNTFVAATAIGIIPASLAFAVIGAGLDGVIDAQHAAYEACAATKGAENCTFAIEAQALLSPEFLLGLTALGVAALIPLLLRLRRRQT